MKEICSFFYHRELECNSRKSRPTWSNRKSVALKYKVKQGKGYAILSWEHTGHSKHTLPTAEQTTLHVNVPRWSIPKSNWLYSLQPKTENHYAVRQTKPGAYCASDHELFIAKFRLKLKKVGKTTRPFRYDLNQFPYDYTVELVNRLTGLDKVDRVSEDYGQRSVTRYKRQWPKPFQRKRNARRQSGCLRRRLYRYLRKEEKQNTREKGKDVLNWMQSSRKQQEEIRKPSYMDNVKK